MVGCAACPVMLPCSMMVPGHRFVRSRSDPHDLLVEVGDSRSFAYESVLIVAAVDQVELVQMLRFARLASLAIWDHFSSLVFGMFNET